MRDPEDYQGRVIADKYRLSGLIGQGAMGTVYSATQRGLDREVAVKIMSSQFAVRAESRARFEREARVAAQLHHPNAIDVFDFGEDDGCVFLVMELLRGVTLREALAEKQALLPLERVFEIGAAIADLLVVAHDIGLTHRDLKPENIFLDRFPDGRERIVVVDFGLAFIDAPNADAVGRLTREGVLGGTPHYMSPEQAQGVAVGPASDIYSLACLLYELACGKVPFAARNLVAVLSRHVYSAPRQLRERSVRRFPSSFDELVMQMLGKDARKRPSAATVRAVLRHLRGAAIDGERERGGDGAHLHTRGSRVLPAPAPVALRDAGVIEVALIGELAAELVVGLGERDIVLVEPGDAGRVVFAPGASAEAANALVEAGAFPVVAVDAGDIATMAAMVRAGVAEMVTRPLSVDDLASKLRRATRTFARRRLPTATPAAAPLPE